MTNNEIQPVLPDLPEPLIDQRHPWLPSLVWLVPLLAALVGLALILKLYMERGPTISIDFVSAEGIEAGKTRVKYKEVEIGLVKDVHLTQDRRQARVQIELKQEAADFADKDSRFWVVRPRVAIGGVSGLGTLLSGAYIGVDAGHSGKRQAVFSGLDSPPIVTSDLPGRQFRLIAEDLGSLDIGSPVLYRRIQVGQVIAYHLNSAGTGLELNIFVQAPFDRFVVNNTKFWQASGVDLSFDANGIKLNTQSLSSLIQGGISFETPDAQEDGVAAADNDQFKLAETRLEAMKQPDGAPELFRVYFQQSLRGLTVGAPVDFRGISLGQVKDIEFRYQPESQDIRIAVLLELFPSRLGKEYSESFKRLTPEARLELIRQLLNRGLRAQLRTGNLLTGQLYVALDFFPDAAQVKVNAAVLPLELPAVAGDLAQLQNQLTSVLSKIDQIPFHELSTELNTSLKLLNRGLSSADVLIRKLEHELAPEVLASLQSVRSTLGVAEQGVKSMQQGLAADSPLLQDLRETLREFSKAARSLKTLTDYLDRYPEALIQGKKEQAQ